MTGDLDSTLASLADSLTMKSSWTSPVKSSGSGKTGTSKI